MSNLTLVIGRKGSGKSSTILEIAQGLSRPSLIVDPGRAKVYTEAGIGFIDPDQIPDFSRQKKGFGRIARISDIIDKKALMAQIFGFQADGHINRAKAFLNGNLFLEDAGSYINSNTTEKVLECVKAFKQYGLNLYLSYHAIDEISQDILRLQPDFLIFKKTGDEPVWSKISKTKKFPNQRNAMKTFYMAAVYGMTPQEIVENYDVYLADIAKDLRQPAPKDDKTRLAFAGWLSSMAHGKKIPSPQQKAMKNYQPFSVQLKL